jgi:hypothetical protein
MECSGDTADAKLHEIVNYIDSCLQIDGASPDRMVRRAEALAQSSEEAFQMVYPRRKVKKVKKSKPWWKNCCSAPEDD